MRCIHLKEQEDLALDLSALSMDEGQTILTQYSKYIEIFFPTPRHHNQWVLRNQGFVGILPITLDLTLWLQPKTSLATVFSLLEWTWAFKGLNLFDQVRQCEDVKEVYERLALLLAQKIATRIRRGLIKAYIAQKENLTYLRGQLVIQEHIQHPWKIELPCLTDEHSVDIDDNRIPLWALESILRSQICSEKSSRLVLQMHRALKSLLTPSIPNVLVLRNREYQRLNEDYRPIHILSRFFIEQVGPTHRIGQKEMLPFAIFMPNLFEQFVAQWLKFHLPQHLTLRWQEKLTLSEHHDINAKIDLVIYDKITSKAVAVLDTKYKSGKKPSNEDINQITTYATALNCTLGILIYPDPSHQDVQLNIGKIEILSMTFSIDQAPEVAGQAFLNRLLTICHSEHHGCPIP